MPECPTDAGGAGWTGMSVSLLAEIARKLEQLAAGETPEAIDLRSLPISPLDMADLKAQLGTGEVRATVDISGRTSVDETRYPGVWMITHLGPDGEILAQLIEIVRVPDLLIAQDADIRQSALALARSLATPAPHTTRRQEDAVDV